ncbi:hypothetical protein DV515_00003632 [Chloebia gouldiae]|uniref:Uncharacterized protein n=1 Tax=Chloebia gouldiae TaxID=44316 RepID=A0A3L8STK6_CHLGU|nr:hypothetical protein DV515_00003632 [Chloebia gouldiae]
MLVSAPEPQHRGDGRASGAKTVENEIFGMLLIPTESLTNGISKGYDGHLDTLKLCESNAQCSSYTSFTTLLAEVSQGFRTAQAKPSSGDGRKLEYSILHAYFGRIDDDDDYDDVRI